MKRRAASSLAARELGDVRNENRVIEARELDVVVLAARPFAQFAEFEPHHARRPSPRRRCRGPRSTASRGPPAESPASAAKRRFSCAGVWSQRRIQVGRRLLQLPQAIVDAAVQVHHVHVLLNQLDGRQESFALQAVLVQILAAAMLEVATSVTPRRNKPSNRPARIIASAMSATKNSSRQITRARRGQALRDGLERLGAPR